MMLWAENDHVVFAVRTIVGLADRFDMSRFRIVSVRVDPNYRLFATEGA